MSDFRHDPIDDQWVAIAKNRRDRPTEFVPLEQLRQQIICPFCKGNEEETPTALSNYNSKGESLALEDDKSSWTVRVVPNKYPSFSSAAVEINAPDMNGSEFHKRSQRHGVQELIIPSSRHITSLSELTTDELKTAWKASQDRITHLRDTDGIEHAMFFLNCRLEAGASLGHIHFQLIGSPVVSRHLQSRVDRDQAHRAEHGCAIVESLMNWEIEHKERVVELTDRFCIVCPFASRFAFQVRVIPRDLNTSFLDIDADCREELANHCRNLVKRFESQIESPAYNLLLQLDPFQANQSGWYMELLPRLTKGAGLELGTDIWVNPVTPESAARRLRP